MADNKFHDMPHDDPIHIYIECLAHAFSLSGCLFLSQFALGLWQKHWEITLTCERIHAFTETLSPNCDLKLTSMRSIHFRMRFIASSMNPFSEFMPANIFTPHSSRVWNQEIGMSENDDPNLLMEVRRTSLNKR